MSAKATLNRFTDFMVGPARLANLLSSFELGPIDMLRQCGGQTAVQLGETLGATADAVGQLLLLLVEEVFYLNESVRTGTLVGLGELYGFQGSTLYDAGNLAIFASHGLEDQCSFRRRRCLQDTIDRLRRRDDQTLPRHVGQG